MNVSKLSPSGRILTKLGISETAWSIGKPLYSRTRKSVLREGGRGVGKSTNDSLSEPSSLWSSASDNLDHVRSCWICWIYET